MIDERGGGVEKGMGGEVRYERAEAGGLRTSIVEEK